MIIENYMQVLATKFPAVRASIIGDPAIYENIVVEADSPALPTKEALDTAALEVEREKAWRNIQAARDLRKAGGVKVGTNWFHSDDPSRIQQIALVMFGANMPPGIMWKTMTGAFVQMTPTLAMQIFQTIAGSDQAIFGRAEYHRSMMMASADPKTYDYSGGWPQTYPEWVAQQASSV